MTLYPFGTVLGGTGEAESMRILVIGPGEGPESFRAVHLSGSVNGCEPGQVEHFGHGDWTIYEEPENG